MSCHVLPCPAHLQNTCDGNSHPFLRPVDYGITGFQGPKYLRRGMIGVECKWGYLPWVLFPQWDCCHHVA